MQFSPFPFGLVLQASGAKQRMHSLNESGSLPRGFKMTSLGCLMRFQAALIF